MSVIELKKISKTYDGGNSFVIKDMDLAVEDKDFVVILGPSGCGKSTTLRMIAGIEGISSGQLLMNGKVMNDIPSKDRDIAMVFQNYALFPHMSVYDNIAFALKINKVDKKEIEKRVANAAKILGLNEFLDRKPGELSGGQQQRVALGRAMVNDSQFFLMDEPLSNLDANLRTQMREEILNLHRRLETTTIFVTHDQVEAMTMATKIVILNKGDIMQVGSPNEIYDKPANYFVANFIGNPKMNFLEAKIIDKEIILKDGTIFAKVDSPDKQKVHLGIRPEDLLVDDQGSFDATVVFTEMLGANINIFMESDFGKLVSSMDRIKDYHINDAVKFSFKVKKAHVFDGETGARLDVEVSDNHEE